MAQDVLIALQTSRAWINYAPARPFDIPHGRGVIRDMPGMPAERVIVAQEAAYPTGAIPPESAPGATPDNQKVFLKRLIASGEPFVYGFAFDACFAAQSSPPGGFGGLWDAEPEPEPAVAILDLGPARRPAEPAPGGPALRRPAWG